MSYQKYILYDIYNLLIKRRVIYNCSLLGNIYFENIYIIKINNIKANVTWFIKKKGTNWGIYKLSYNYWY